MTGDTLAAPGIPLRLAAEIVERGPWQRGGVRCFYCETLYPDEHSEDCLWRRAVAVLKGQKP